MFTEEATEKYLRGLVFPVLLCVFAFQVYAERAFFADGVNYFFGILMHVDFPWWDYQRDINHIITMWPTIAAIRLGLHDMAALRFIYSSWMLFCPLAMWGCAVWSVRCDALFWPMVLVVCFVYFGTNFFAVGEYNLCFAMTAYCFAILARPLTQSRFQRSFLWLTTALLPMQYSASLFLAGVLFLMIILKPEEEWRGASRIYRAALIAALLVTIACALWEILLPRDAKQFAAARSTYALWHNHEFWLVLCYSLMTSSLFFLTKSWARYVAGIACLTLWAALIFDTSRGMPGLHHGVRAYVSAVYAALLFGLWILRRNTTHMATAPKLSIAGFGFVLLAALSFFDIQQSLKFRGYMDAIRGVANSHTGIVPYEMSGLVLLPANERFNWDWTLPLLSLVLRDNERGGIIIPARKYHGYLPVDPRQEIPDLSPYYRRTTS